MEELVAGSVVGVADLGHENLDLHRLHLVGEDLPQALRVLVGEAPRIDVLTAERVPLHVRVANPRDPELVELVVLADPGERDPVVDLADLPQCRRRVLGADRDTVVEPEPDEAPTASDALAGVIGAVLHDLLGSDVERHVHDGQFPCRRAMSAWVRAARSSSLIRV